MIPQIFLGGGDAAPQRISTKHVLFIFSGAFTGLDERLKQKHVPKNMGFLGGGHDDEEEDDDVPKSYLKQATSADFGTRASRRSSSAGFLFEWLLILGGRATWSSCCCSRKGACCASTSATSRATGVDHSIEGRYCCDSKEGRGRKDGRARPRHGFRKGPSASSNMNCRAPASRNYIAIGDGGKPARDFRQIVGGRRRRARRRAKSRRGARRGRVFCAAFAERHARRLSWWIS